MPVLAHENNMTLEQLKRMYEEIKIELPQNNDRIFNPRPTPISIDKYKKIISE